ncbi:hypothetical protein ART_4086 [Arthrobacter sp. PAMC 25486]|nr:hypothetical protein ART_4086 [Arthrobacter sp. PAMC 25486]
MTATPSSAASSVDDGVDDRAGAGAPQPSRRELNKAATREAIAAAALNFLRNRDLTAFTVDDVAAAAGVSRRTFFNYFSSVEAAVASYTEDFLDQVIAELEARPLDEPLLQSARAALSNGDHADALAILAETVGLTQDPQLGRFQLQAWEDCSQKITEVARHRLPAGTDELYVCILVGAIVGSCRAAFMVWFQRHGTNITADTLADLRGLLDETIAQLRHGFKN